MQYLYYDAHGGELFEDIVQHESHDIFWCYGFERDVAQYKKITSNHRTNKFFYTSFYLNRCFKITHINIKKDQDGVLPDTRDLLKVHKYVKMPKYSCREPVLNNKICEFKNLRFYLLWK